MDLDHPPLRTGVEFDLAEYELIGFYRIRTEKQQAVLRLPSDSLLKFIRTGFVFVSSIRLNDSAEAHESHGEKSGGQQCDGRALHCLRHLVHRQLLAYACKEDKRNGKAYSGS